MDPNERNNDDDDDEDFHKRSVKMQFYAHEY